MVFCGAQPSFGPHWSHSVLEQLHVQARPSAAQIARRRRAHQEKHPDARVISLGIGDTTEPIPRYIADAMQRAAAGLGTLEGYSGCSLSAAQTAVSQLEYWAGRLGAAHPWRGCPFCGAATAADRAES